MSLPPPPRRSVADPRASGSNENNDLPPPPVRNEDGNAVDDLDDLGIVKHADEAYGKEEDLRDDCSDLGETEYAPVSTAGGITSPSFMTEIINRKSVVGADLDPDNLLNDAGFSRTTKLHLDEPDSAFFRVMLKDEDILESFSYYYPKSKITKSYQTHLLLTLCTGGLYLLYLLFGTVINLVQKGVGIEPIGCCRGRMVSTSRGRLIFWQLQARQWRWFGIDGRAHFNTTQKFRIFNIKDIKQTTVRYHRVPAFMCFLEDSKASLEIVFDSFPTDRGSYSSYFKTSPAKKYIEDVHESSNAFDSFYDGVFSLKKTEKSVFGAAQPIVIRLVSKEGDLEYRGQEHGISSFESILKLNNEYTKHLNQNDCFTSETLTSVTDTDDLYGFKVVEDDDEVVFPKQYVPLTAGEKIISKIGQKYVVSNEDILLSVVTLGSYYFLHLNNKMKQRTAIVMTNKRLIEIFTQCPDNGRIPINLAKPMMLRVRSIFPGEVYSGFIKISSGNCMIQSSLLCSGGDISILLPQHTPHESLSFAKSMQFVTSRLTSLDIDISLAGLKMDTNQGISDEVRQYCPILPHEKIVYHVSSESGKVPRGRLIITDHTIVRLSKLVDGGQMSLWLPAKDITGQVLNMEGSGAHPVNFLCSLCNIAARAHLSRSYIYRMKTKDGLSIPIFSSTHDEIDVVHNQTYIEDLMKVVALIQERKVRSPENV